MTVVWAALTMACGAAKTFQQLAAIRFFLGIAEASTYSGTQYIIGSWYKGPEIGKRIGLFQASGMAGTMFAGEFDFAPSVGDSRLIFHACQAS